MNLWLAYVSYPITTARYLEKTLHKIERAAVVSPQGSFVNFFETIFFLHSDDIEFRFMNFKNTVYLFVSEFSEYF
jgi:hypothetical protein